ncbi:protein of unknown function [Burkholderia multivorans]
MPKWRPSTGRVVAANGAARIISHAAVSGLGAAMGGGNVAGAVGGTIAGDLVGNAAATALSDSVGGKVLSNVAAGLAGAAAGGALGGSAGAMTGAGGALNADAYNRQLHPQEKTLAKLLADKSGGRYTQAQIEDQMRQMGVTINGVTESGAATTLIGQTPTDMGAQWIGAPSTSDGQTVLTQKLAPADPQLQAYILANYNSASPGQVPSQFTYQQTGSGSFNVTGPFAKFDQSDINFVRGTAADASSMISTNAGRVSSVAAAGAAVTPCSVVCDGIAFAGTVVGITADAIGQLAKPDAGQYLFNGFTSIASNYVSAAKPVLAPVVNELTNQVNGSGIATSGQNRLNRIVGTSSSNGKQ